MSQSFNFNLIDLTNNKVIDDIKTLTEKKVVMTAVKVASDNGFVDGHYISLVIPETNGDISFIDITGYGDYDFIVETSDLYNGSIIDSWFDEKDKDITELENLSAFDAIKYVCRHWDEL